MRPLLRLVVPAHVLAMCALVYSLQRVDLAEAVTGDREAFAYWDEASVWLLFVVGVTYVGILGGTAFVKWKGGPFVFFSREGRWVVVGSVALLSPVLFVVLSTVWAGVSARGG